MGDLCWLALKIGDDATGLENNKDACGDVPRSEAQFPESVKAAAGDIAEVEGRRAGAAQTGRALHQAGQHFYIWGDALAVLEGEARADEGAGWIGRFRCVD